MQKSQVQEKLGLLNEEIVAVKGSLIAVRYGRKNMACFINRLTNFGKDVVDEGAEEYKLFLSATENLEEDERRTVELEARKVELESEIKVLEGFLAGVGDCEGI